MRPHVISHMMGPLDGELLVDAVDGEDVLLAGPLLEALGEVDVPAQSERGQDDAERERHLGGGERDDEDREDLPCCGVVGKGRTHRDEDEARRGEDQFDPDEHEHGVTARQHAVDARTGEHGGECEGQEEVDHFEPPSLRVPIIARAPTSASSPWPAMSPT